VSRADSPCDFKELSPAEALLLLLKDSTNKIILNDNQYLAVDDVRNHAVWTFTKIGHAANPAMVCRYPLQMADGRWHAQIEARCGGPKEACDAFVEAFKRLP
jgi:hypothetical protein